MTDLAEQFELHPKQLIRVRQHVLTNMEVLFAKDEVSKPSEPSEADLKVTLKDQGHKADHGVGTDTLRQSVMNRSNLNLRLQHLKATLNIGKEFTTDNDVLRGLGPLSSVSCGLITS